jgi:hypothetical protein
VVLNEKPDHEKRHSKLAWKPPARLPSPNPTEGNADAQINSTSGALTELHLDSYRLKMLPRITGWILNPTTILILPHEQTNM